MGATLTLTRRARFAFELVRGPFRVLVDGAEVGDLAMHDTLRIPVAPGRHLLVLRAGRRRSVERTFDVPDGDAVDFTCSGATTWPVWAVSLLVPTLGVALHRG